MLKTKQWKLSAQIVSKHFTISSWGIGGNTSYLASTASQTRMVESHDPLNLGKKLRVGGPTKIPQLWEVLLMLQKFGKPPPVGCKKNLVNTRDELPSKIFVQQYLWGEVFNLTLFGWLSTKSMVRISKQPSEKSEFWYKQTTIPHQHEGYVSIQQPGKIWKVKAMKGFILFMEEIRLSTWDVRNPLKGQFAYQLVYDFFIQPMIQRCITQLFDEVWSI